MFDGVDYDGVGVRVPEVAGVHEVGHEPVPVFFSENGIEAAFRVFDIVAQFQRRADITEERAAGRRASSERSQPHAVTGVGLGL